MKIEKFEDIIAWQKAKILTVEIKNQFNSCHDYSFRDQIMRALISIMNSIAEGFERKGDKEFKYFLFIAKGSCAEVRSMLYLCLEFNYIDRDQFRKYSLMSIEISKLLSGFIKTL